MAFDEGVAQRLRETYLHLDTLGPSQVAETRVVEKKMFGGLAFMVDGHMSCGVVKDELMVRVGPELYDEAINRPHARKMDFTGRSLKGFVYVGTEGFENDEDLRGWVELSLRFVLSLPAK